MRTFWVSENTWCAVMPVHGYIIGEGTAMRAFVPSAAGSDARELALAFKAASQMLALLHDIAKADEESIAALAEMGIAVGEQSHAMAERIRAVIALAEGQSE